MLPQLFQLGDSQTHVEKQSFVLSCRAEFAELRG